MHIKNFYTVSPNDLEPGDVLVCVVTLHVNHHKDKKGRPTYRVYRCEYPPQLASDGVPQGSSILTNVEKVAQALFPVVVGAGLKPE